MAGRVERFIELCVTDFGLLARQVLTLGRRGRGFAMENTTQFVNDLNVARFFDQLRFAHDPAARASLRRLLLEEEDKLGHSIERLCKDRRHVAEGNRRIALQKAPIARRGADGKDVALTDCT